MKRFLALLVIAACLSVGGSAQAAPLNYSGGESISLTSPSTTLVIATGSVADALTVNATSVAVTLSSSTGGTLTITSGSYDITVAPSSGGGTAILSCNSGIASVVISQSTGQTTYTVAPTASRCTTPSGGGGSGGGSVGVASQYGIPNYGLTTPIPISTAATSGATVSSSSLLAEINVLNAELAALLAETGQSTPSSSLAQFMRNLSFGMTGNDVRDLQNLLITHASGPAAAKLKAHGTTETFGILTYNALVEFQKKVGVIPASGYFGPKTRAYVNGLSQHF